MCIGRRAAGKTPSGENLKKCRPTEFLLVLTVSLGNSDFGAELFYCSPSSSKFSRKINWKKALTREYRNREFVNEQSIRSHWRVTRVGS